MERVRRRHRRRSRKRILGALLALAVILAAGPLRQRIADLIDPPAWIIVLDSGHGGYDPGSIAADGTMEKDIALQIALRAGAILEGESDLRVVYTRDSDAVSWPAREAEDLADPGAYRPGSSCGHADLDPSECCGKHGCFGL